MYEVLHCVDPDSNCKILELDVDVFGASRRICPVLLWDHDSASLIDTGFPGGLQILRQAVEEAGVPFASVRRVFVTHHDWDHIGILPEMLDTDDRIEVYSHMLEKPYIEGALPNLKLTPQRISERIAALPKVYQSKAAAIFAHLPTAPVHHTFRDGEVLPFYGGIHVVHTPGHTLGHACFFLPQFRLLIAGDQLRVEEGLLVGPSPEFTPDLSTAHSSVWKLLAYDIDRVSCFHGGYYGPNAAERIAELAQNYE